MKVISIAAGTQAMTACYLPLAWTDLAWTYFEAGYILGFRANDHKHTQIISCQNGVCKRPGVVD